MGVLFLFFDGIGVGRDDPETNPFAAIGARRLGAVAGRPDRDGAAFAALDATLGVPGLPQSATGQTTLLTGVNAARVAGRHMVGVPGPTLRPLIESESLFCKLVRVGNTATSANAYTRQYFEARRPRFSAATCAVRAAGLPFRMWAEEGLRDAALFHDYTGESMARLGLPVRRRTAAQAAEVLGRLVGEHDFVFYEYFLTDLVAHRGGFHDKLEQARRVEGLVGAVLAHVDLDRHDVIVTSDHGNLEESDHARHTLNPVPFLVWGPHAAHLAAEVQAMTDVTPALVTLTSARDAKPL